MIKIHEEDQYNDCYGRERMYLALQQRKDAAVKKYGIIQSMNSAGGRCHDNARCESMWARMKEELFYSREDESENYFMKELKTMIWRYYMSYWLTEESALPNVGCLRQYEESSTMIISFSLHNSCSNKMCQVILTKPYRIGCQTC